MPTPIQLRLFTEDDLDFADRMREKTGWNQRRDDWARYRRHEPGGCFVAEWDGHPAGTVTTTRYGDDLAWIGMMLVDPAYRRRGIATALMEGAMDYLRERNVRCIKLDATPEGRPVYERLGFRAEWTLERWEWEPAETETDAGNAGTPPAEDDRDRIDAVMDLDRAAFGADRLAWLRALAADARRVKIRRDGSGDVSAYGMLRPGLEADYFGPQVADPPEAAAGLVEDLLAGRDRRIFWDLPAENDAARDLAARHGFARTKSILRMWTGEERVEGNARRQFASGDPSTG